MELCVTVFIILLKNLALYSAVKSSGKIHTVEPQGGKMQVLKLGFSSGCVKEFFFFFFLLRGCVGYAAINASRACASYARLTKLATSLCVGACSDV